MPRLLEMRKFRTCVVSDLKAAEAGSRLEKKGIRMRREWEWRKRNYHSETVQTGSAIGTIYTRDEGTMFEMADQKSEKTKANFLPTSKFAKVIYQHLWSAFEALGPFLHLHAERATLKVGLDWPEKVFRLCPTNKPTTDQLPVCWSDSFVFPYKAANEELHYGLKQAASASASATNLIPNAYFFAL